VVVVNDSSSTEIEAWRTLAADFRDDACVLRLLVLETGEGHWPSVNAAARWAHIARLSNLAITDPTFMDCQFGGMYVESDLDWEPSEVLEMHTRAVDEEVCVSPLNLNSPREYYDTWGTQIDGRTFRREIPWSSSVPSMSTDPCFVPAEYVAGCTVFPTHTLSLIREGKIRFSAQDCYRGLCDDINRHSKLELATHIGVFHP